MTVEKILQVILEKVTNLQEGQKILHEGQQALEKRQESLEVRQGNLEKGQQALIEKMNIVYEQTGFLTEFKTITIKSLEEIQQKINSLVRGQDQVLKDIEILAGEIGKHKLDVERLKERVK